MSRFLSPRFGAEAGFLIAVAAVLYLLEASRPAIVGGMFVAWLAVAVFEVLASRDRAEPAPAVEPAPPERPAAVAVVPGGEEEELYVAPAAEPAPAAPASTEASAVTPTPAASVTEGLPARPEDAPPAEPDLVEPAVPAERTPEPEPEPEARPEPEEAPSAAAPVAGPEPSTAPEPAARAEGEEPAAPAPEPEPEPEEAFPAPPPPPVLTSVASAPPEPPRAEEEGAAAAQGDEAPEVVELRPGRPSGWNVWELERMVRESEGSDPSGADERAYLLMYLRDFASPDGMLPPDFDGLVRESFGDLLAVRR